ncbi:MAG TPA: isochorismatase family cysteine hydrolase [Candidatus Dormibacteraeota bacterium]|nr:isochorismatase family cysteine hydrolase [Candidatus Dormibacteraeota bacterium]HEX2680154.1 isochorismatase family cysteine hydrolase [Candidatus Dormibacteraeota bacterium]
MREVTLPASPEALALDLDRTALIVVDMQNAFASPGGMLDIAGIEVRPARDAVSNARMVCDAARRASVPVIYLTIGYPPDQSTAGGPDSPNPRKELALSLMRERPELRGKLLTFGTWDFQIVDELAPLDGDTVIVKSRYSGFAGTSLDSVLRSRSVRNLLFVGIASNVCVESTLRDAYFLEYWPVMIKDATMPAGDASIQRATEYNVETFFGWTALSEDVATTLLGRG